LSFASAIIVIIRRISPGAADPSPSHETVLRRTGRKCDSRTIIMADN
jgi:hypothetical protein